VPDSEERRPVTTICVKGLLVASKEKIQSAQRETLSIMINAHWMKIYATGF
jgi:hypothetical protein